jgi:O-methyltransferase involved in polyketide biosynthesis
VSSEPKIDGATLTGVSETALLTLKARATEARRPDAIIDDPMAIELVDAIDFAFRADLARIRLDLPANGSIGVSRDSRTAMI